MKTISLLLAFFAAAHFADGGVFDQIYTKR